MRREECYNWPWTQYLQQCLMGPNSAHRTKLPVQSGRRFYTCKNKDIHFVFYITSTIFMRKCETC